MVVTGFACLILGIISVARSHGKKVKIVRGRKMAIVGIILIVIFGTFLARTLYKQISMGEEYVFLPLFLAFLLFPIIVLVAVVCLVFFLVYGIDSLRVGYKRDEEGKRDKESIILGYILITIGLIITASIAMFVAGAFSGLVISINKSGNKPSGSASSQSNALLNYLFAKFNK